MNIETRFYGSLQHPAKFKEAPTPSEHAEQSGSPAPDFQWQRFDAQNPADRAPLLASAVRVLEDGRQSASEKQRAVEALKSIGYGWDRTLDPSENLMVLRGAVQHEKQRERQRQEQMANTEAFQKYYRENIEQHVEPQESSPRETMPRAVDGPATYRMPPQAPAQATVQKETPAHGVRGFFGKAASGIRNFFRRG